VWQGGGRGNQCNLAISGEPEEAPLITSLAYLYGYKYRALAELYQSNSNFPVVNIYSLSGSGSYKLSHLGSNN
jgi:hypothetical protein